MEKKSTTKAKKAPTPYIKFVKKERSLVVKENPKMTFGEIGKELGTRWRALSVEEKAKYK